MSRARVRHSAHRACNDLRRDGRGRGGDAPTKVSGGGGRQGRAPVCGATGPCAIEPLIHPTALAPRPRLGAVGARLVPARWIVTSVSSTKACRSAVDAAFVFALDRFGAVDAEPVPIVGPIELDDAEALTAGPDQTYFLLTSHAPNRSGKVGRQRRRLLRLVLQDRRLRVTGDLDLFHGKGEVPRQVEKLGLPRATPVDLEGPRSSTARSTSGSRRRCCRAGRRSSCGSGEPVGGFRGRQAAKEGAVVLGRRRQLTATSPAGVEVPVRGSRTSRSAPTAPSTCARTRPKAAALDGGGALWRIAQPRGGRMTTALLRAGVPDLKPEGVAVGPAGDTLGQGVRPRRRRAECRTRGESAARRPRVGHRSRART